MPNDRSDQPRPVRPGEELDTAKLEVFLRGRWPEWTGPVAVEQFPRGYSNLTYLVRIGERELVLRRPPRGAQIRTAHDMGREFRILSKLHLVYKKVPRALLYCPDDAVVGAPFYLMERVAGIILRASPPAGLDLSAPTLRQLSENFVDNLVELHGIDPGSAGLSDLGRPEGYVTRQIEGWTQRYQNARTDDLPAMEQVAQWLLENKPGEAGACLIHNDYKYDNLVLDPRELPRIRAVLDWEMATVGDPLMDLGTTLGYWIDPKDPEEWQQQAFGLTNRPGNLRREELLDRYLARCAPLTRQPACDYYYYAYGLFKIAVIVQQIYARYKLGLTQDERFARLIDVVRQASQMAWLAIQKRRVSRLAS